MHKNINNLFVIFVLLFVTTSLSNGYPTSVTVKSSYNKQIINLIVWICPDPTLFAMIQSSLQQYRTVDDINTSVEGQVTGYKNSIWLVNTINYSRTTADTDPLPNTSSKNLCFVQAPNEKLIIFVAAVVS